MRSAVIVFPASNCDRDVAVALTKATGTAPTMLWHGDRDIPSVDLIVLPGGFSYGDYLRAGAMAAHSPIVREVVRHAKRGVPVLGICNGFQILTETGLLPGALLRNASLKFICKTVSIRVEKQIAPFTALYETGQKIRIPIAHHDGNYFADDDTLQALNGEDRVLFRYCDDNGSITSDANPNGSAENIAGITNDAGTVLGMMPHPERVVEPALGGTDGQPLFQSLLEAVA